MSAETYNYDEQLFETCTAFVQTYCREEMARVAETCVGESPPTIHISWRDLSRYNPDFADDYLRNRERVEAHLIDAFASTMVLPASITEGDVKCGSIAVQELPEHQSFDVGNYQPTEVVGELHGVAGQVSRVTTPQTLATVLAYECTRCGTITRVGQTDHDVHEPQECDGCERQGPFVIKDEESEYEDYQRVRLETPPERTGREGSEHLDLTLRDDLVRAVRPGERVTLNSELTMEPSSDDRPTFDVTGDVMSVEHDEQDIEDVNIDEYRDEIEEIAASGNPLEQIVESIAPTIYGYEDVKEALAYQLFGGRHIENADGSERRGTINILLIGDPGVGKSELLRYAARIAPRSLYTSGSGTTATGLTAAAVQDDFGGGGWTIKAGALVQAHNGVCAIDELDDMSEDDRAGLLEAMSNLQITKSAAGENVTLPAQTTVLAGANPVHGRFDEHAAIADQVDLDPALISRFDLLFTFQDQQDSELDNEIAAHMTATARDDVDDVEPEIDQDVLRAYIAYARRNYDPTLSSEADRHLRQRYVEIRTANDQDGPVPTTPRLLEAMIRLAEASARVRLSETVTEDDAKRAADLAVACLKDVGIDPETGEMDVDVVETGESKSQRDRIKAVTGILHELESEHSGGVPMEEWLDRCEDAGIERDKAEHEIEKIKQKGDVYKPNSGGFKSV